MAPANRRRPCFDPRLFAWGLNDQQPAPRRTVGVNNVHLVSRGLKGLGLLDVRFTPKSGHVQCNDQCLLWAKSGQYVRFVSKDSPLSFGLVLPRFSRPFS